MKTFIKIVVGIVVKLIISIICIAGILIGGVVLLNKFMPETLDGIFEWLKSIREKD